MRQNSWLIALLCLIFGHTVWQSGGRFAVIKKVNRTFQDFLIDANKISRRDPVPVTLVEMEEAETWTALDYCLFLKNLPTENPPIVVFTSLPKLGNTAFDRAFVELSMRQPRLVLPIDLSTKPPAPGETFWWLKGWPAQGFTGSQMAWQSVRSDLPETLRGTVAVGVLRGASESGRVPVFFRLGAEIVPSVALRSILLAEKTPLNRIRIDHDLFLGHQRIRLEKDASINVDDTFRRGIRQVLSSDLLLSIDDQRTTEAISTRLRPEPLQGVVVLGALSKEKRNPPGPDGLSYTSAEWVALTIATVCNGPLLAPADGNARFVILIGAVLLPLLVSQQRRIVQSFTMILVLAIYIFLSIDLADRYGLAMPLFLPLAVLLLGTILHQIFLPRRNP